MLPMRPLFYFLFIKKNVKWLADWVVYQTAVFQGWAVYILKTNDILQNLTIQLAHTRQISETYKIYINKDNIIPVPNQQYTNSR